MNDSAGWKAVARNTSSLMSSLLYAFEGFAVQRSASQPSYKLLTHDFFCAFVERTNTQLRLMVAQ